MVGRAPTTPDPGDAPGRLPNGPGAAAILAAGMGSLALGLAVLGAGGFRIGIS